MRQKFTYGLLALSFFLLGATFNYVVIAQELNEAPLIEVETEETGGLFYDEIYEDLISFEEAEAITNSRIGSIYNSSTSTERGIERFVQGTTLDSLEEIKVNQREMINLLKRIDKRMLTK